MSNAPEIKDVTIVGGGFAGLAAALRLERAGCSIQIVEKRPFFGGRAYSFRDKTSGETLDNGQHLLMGCYHETMDFLRDLGTLPKLEIQSNLNLSFAHLPRRFHRLSCPNLPAPLHLGVGLTTFSGLKLGDKWRMARLLSRLKKVSNNGVDLDRISVREFLERQGQSPESIQNFWEPIGLGALNESLELASAKLFVEVLRRALLSTKRDSSLAISAVGLSDLYASPAQKYFSEKQIPMYFQTLVTGISRNGPTFDISTDQAGTLKSRAIILAVPPPALSKMLAVTEFSALTAGLERFQSSAIISINLWIEGFQPSQTLVGLIGSPLHWLFNKAKIMKDEKSSHVTLVISGANALAAESKEKLVTMAQAELEKFFPEIHGKKLLHSQVVKELDATYGTRVGLNSWRPPAVTQWPGLWLAGDWTDTGLPATIESAVLSGHRAADAYLQSGKASNP